MGERQYETNAERQRAYRQREAARRAAAKAGAHTPAQGVFTAPFRIEYPDGRPLFEALLEDGNGIVRLYNPNGVLAVTLEAPTEAGSGGGVVTHSPDGNSQAHLYADDNGGEVFLTRGERRNIQVTVDGAVKNVPTKG